MYFGQTGIIVDLKGIFVGPSGHSGFIWVTVSLYGVIVGIPKVTWVSYIGAIRGHSRSNWCQMCLI